MMLLYTKAMQLLSLIRLWIPFRWKVTWEWNTNAIILAWSNDCIPIPQAGCLLQCFDTVDAFAGQIFCKVWGQWVLIIWLIVHHVCEDMRTNSFFTASTGNFRRWLLPRNRGGKANQFDKTRTCWSQLYVVSNVEVWVKSMANIA
mgnify:FL=1